MTRAFHAVIFAAFTLLWTWKLLEPQPVPESFTRELRDVSEEIPFVLAKLLHLLGYAFLTVLGATLRPTNTNWRWAVSCVFILHGIGTEIAQTYVPNRSGTVRDALIDACGVVLALFFMRWHAPSSPQAG